MIGKHKAIALIHIGKDLCFSDFSLDAEPNEDIDDFWNTANYVFNEKHGPDSVDITHRIVDYFEMTKEYEVIDIVLCESADYIHKEHTHKACEPCKGTGEIGVEECGECQGYGKVLKTETL